MENPSIELLKQENEQLRQEAANYQAQQIAIKELLIKEQERRLKHMEFVTSCQEQVRRYVGDRHLQALFAAAITSYN